MAIAPLPERFRQTTPILYCRTSTLFSYIDADTGEPGIVRRLLVPERTSETERAAVREQFFREGAVLQGLAHRGLPRIRELLEEDGRLHLVLDYFEGNTLAHVAERMGRLPQEKLLVRWMSQIAGILAYLHGQAEPIYYRNLRPDTVFLTFNAIIILVDFGIARLVDPASERQTLFRQTGDMAFAPPEQFTETRSTPMVDIYSLGATMYTLATKKPPPSGWDRMISQAPVEPMRALNPNLSEGFETLINRTLSLDPADRPQSATEVLELLQTLTGPAPAVPAPEPSDPIIQTPPPAPVLPGPEPPALMPVLGEPERPAPVLGEPEPPSPTGETGPPGLTGETGPPGPALGDPGPTQGDPGPARKFSWRLPWFGRGAAHAAPTVSSAPQVQPTPEDLDRWPRVDLSSVPLDRTVGQLIPETVSKVIAGICIGRPSDTELLLAVQDPSRIEIYDHIQLVTQRKFTAALVRADPHLIELAREFIYKVGSRFADVQWLEWLQKKKHQADAVAVVRQYSDDDEGHDEGRGPAREAVDRIFKEAISLGASDIHVETYENEMVLRYRIDGVLSTMESWPRRQAVSYLKRIKILANMDIAQDRVPQGGRISLRVADREFDLRVSAVPVNHGESLVMRLLNKGSFNLKLEDLGFSEANMTLFRRLVAQPHGLVLVSGPTGAGKSTTLYAALSEINRPDRKILTVEDPIEYEMSGITQVQVNTAPREEEKRVTFSRALREFLRQDPDVILVGEIRDDETASISIQAALTGHLVLSTIHTNDAIGIVTRLRDRGIESFLLASTLSGAVAQRLVRRLCIECKEPDTDPLDPSLGGSVLDGVTMYKPRGCLACRNTGYKGRVSLYEVFENTVEMRKLIGQQSPEDDMLKLALSQGLKTLYLDGLSKVAAGTVSLAEVKRVCMT